MSNQYNESIKENLLDEVSSMSVDNFMTLLDDLKIEDCNYIGYKGGEVIDSLIYLATEQLYEQL
jgi:hypothetical protein